MKTKLLYSSALIMSGIMTSGMLLANTTTYTTDADFASGSLNGVNYDAPNNNQLQIDTTGTTFPYLWVANAGEASVSKINTDGDGGNGCEEARYLTSFGNPSDYRNWGGWSGPGPSRTAVDVDGNVYVANRRFDGRSADLIKIAVDGGIDRNGDGIIQTSEDLNNSCTIDPSEMLAVIDDGDGILEASDFLDERVVWVKQFGATNGLGRSVCLDPDGNIWAGTYNTREYYKFDPNGNLLAGPISTSPASNYGCAVDGDGILWGATLSSRLAKLDTTTPLPAGGTFLGTFTGNSNYGIALGKDKVYLGSYLRSFDRTTNTFDPYSGQSGGTGVAVDGQGNVWFGTPTLRKFATDASGNLNPTPLCSVNTQGSRGPIVGKGDHIWTINMSANSISQYDNNCNFISTVPVGRTPYTYSDATGFGQRTVTDPSGIWTVTTDGGDNDTVWNLISWNNEAEGSIPGDASIEVQVRSANIETDLALQAYTTVNNNDDPGLTGRYIQTRTVLRPSSDGVSPVLSDLSVTEAIIIIDDPVSCDVNDDGVIDRFDIRLIGSHRNEAVPPGDPAYDIDEDGVITVNDARKCTLLCDNPRCAPAAP